jgi:hypothetical protein
MRVALIAVPLFTILFPSLGQTSSLQLPQVITFHDVHAYVTGYNTVPGQTDDTPCIAASGANICGRTNAVACPRRISLGTFLVIRGEIYICEDRLAKKYDSRFDISCDKDTDCPGQVTGWVDIKVFARNPCRLPPSPLSAVARPLPRLAAITWQPALGTARSTPHNRSHWARAA